MSQGRPISEVDKLDELYFHPSTKSPKGKLGFYDRYTGIADPAIRDKLPEENNENPTKLRITP